MIVMITNKCDEHADRLAQEFHLRGIDFTRINTEDFPQRILGSVSLDSEGFGAHLILPLRELDIGQVKSVWYRRPLPPVVDPGITNTEYSEFARNQSAEFLHGLWCAMTDCLWVNWPPANAKAEHKIYQLRVAREIGFRVPTTMVTNDPQKAKRFFDETGGRMVVKSLYQMNLRHIEDGRKKVVCTHLLLESEVEYLDSIILSPAILQAYVDKDVELRITIIGDRVFPVAIYSQETQFGRVDWRKSLLTEEVEYEAVSLSPDIEDMCLTMVSRLGLKFAAIDMILTPEGEYVFLEVNPNGQWTWLEEQTGLPMVDTMVKLLSQT